MDDPETCNCTLHSNLHSVVLVQHRAFLLHWGKQWASWHDIYASTQVWRCQKSKLTSLLPHCCPKTWQEQPAFHV